jgi:hypothetical protein
LMFCSVLGLLGSGLTGVVGIQWSGVLAAFPASLLAATCCGSSGLIGESFTDARFGNGRSFVLMLGSLTAGAITALPVVSGQVASETALAWGPVIVWLGTVLLVRKIPTPVLSQRRQDEISQAEADQILATTTDILEDTVT